MNVKLPKIQIVACHRRPDRSFFYKGKQFPLCARCTGIVLGYLTVPLFLFNIVVLSIWIAVLMNVPAFIDGYTQALGLRKSNNFIRLITGILSGVGQVAIIAIIGKYLGQLVSVYIK